MSESSSTPANPSRTGAGTSRKRSGQQTDLIQDRGRSVAEWTTFAISLAILVGVVGVITWLSFSGDDLPPIITVEAQMEDIREEASGYYVPIVIRNDGDHTVADAVIQGELDTGSGEPEMVDLTVSYLAGGEEVRGTLIFTEDPAQGELTTGVASFKSP